MKNIISMIVALGIVAAMTVPTYAAKKCPEGEILDTKTGKCMKK